jgi:hypothetical protein
LVGTIATCRFLRWGHSPKVGYVANQSREIPHFVDLLLIDGRPTTVVGMAGQCDLAYRAEPEGELDQPPRARRS